MRVWGKKAATTAAVLDMGWAAATGLSRQELLQKTLLALARDGRADRIGAWIEPPDTEEARNQTARGFRGLVWDREDRNVPPEWRNLSPETPLPQALLAAGHSVEQELEHGALPLIGPLLELRRAMWVPIERSGRLRGVLLAGSRRRHGEIPTALFEAAAAGLALAMELEEEQKRDREHRADLGLVKQALASAGGEQSALTLAELVENCTAGADFGSGLGATFAAVGVVSAGGGSGEGAAVSFHWTSGDYRVDQCAGECSGAGHLAPGDRNRVQHRRRSRMRRRLANASAESSRFPWGPKEK